MMSWIAKRLAMSARGRPKRYRWLASARGERVVELGRVLRGIAARGRNEADLRARLARQREDVGVEGRAVGLNAEAAAAHRDDLLSGRRGRHWRVGWWP